jgi:hypothetical protein
VLCFEKPGGAMFGEYYWRHTADGEAGVPFRWYSMLLQVQLAILGVEKTVYVVDTMIVPTLEGWLVPGDKR